MSWLAIGFLFWFGLNAIRIGHAQLRAERRRAQFYREVADALGEMEMQDVRRLEPEHRYEIRRCDEPSS